ncbi:hypothetical protein ITP53_31070 [Nonomuraea sp. K274]|uniref:Uncharacterized protein n=1 Tax=Nonomuraea cypriaca TaxID=1187855 RepID=A0A931ADV2_9ACTN|nr:hypothetical protein [Nonomuraea cypriaca]MBF8190093.1 hypothetical protein [Nonomuraea cypriaca]
MEALLVVGPDGKSTFNRLKKPAQRATWSRFMDQVSWLDQVDALGDTDAWLDGVAPSKIADFAGEADARTPTPCRATTRSSRWRCWRA